MSTFRQSPRFTGFNNPSRIEVDIADLAHEGTIPLELNGAFYRVQPDPCFVSRSKDPPQGDCWIVQVCNRIADHRSDLLVFDVLEIEKGPIATIAIPIRLRFGLHGNWANADEIGLAA